MDWQSWRFNVEEVEAEMYMNPPLPMVAVDIEDETLLKSIEL
jgi:hypothetical protein